jgi:hypothetical protein
LRLAAQREITGRIGRHRMSTMRAISVSAMTAIALIINRNAWS